MRHAAHSVRLKSQFS